MNTLLAGCSPLAFVALLVAQAPVLTHGPFRGHVDATSMHVWARASEAGEYSLQLTALTDGKGAAATAVAEPAHDHVLHFVVDGLTAATAFTVRIARGEHVLFTGGPWTTATPDDAGTATIAFGSCANDKLFPEQPIWGRILARAPRALVLLGDTPYIDLGTVAARRQRHREFFALPAIAATLGAIPTWTTWDDHDYAANDEFGAVKGSETARPVFVEYHAHAGYGDGQRGIYTRFRQGPIEVFLLDTRSFADTEVSAFGTNARSLLGKAQLQWLQQGLLASTAPFKVLACGMVWNGGVRPGKKDCWGNWDTEWQGLCSWLRVHDIEGIVLVSGDVHRSRVVLHRPFADVVLPEFVTSPLAQNVIETNAVPVPGLVFDAGEASSCLFLTATRGRRDGDGRLRAVFQAGDGREFHVRELTEESLRRNAAADHRELVAWLQTVFGHDFTGLPTVEWQPGTPLPTPESAGGAAWRAAVARAEPAFQRWQRAVTWSPRCRFATAPDGEPGSEYVGQLSLGLGAMQNLVVARCMQAIADGQRDTLVALVTSLLAFARQLQQEPHPFAWRQAADAERQVVALYERLGKLSDGGVLIDVRELVRAHLAERGDPAGAWQAMRREALPWFDCFVERIQLGDDRKAQAARTRRTEVREHFLRALAPRFDAGAAVLAGASDAPGERAPAAAPPAADLDGKGEAGPETAAALGRMLADQLWGLHAAMPRGQVDVLVALRAAAK